MAYVVLWSGRRLESSVSRVNGLFRKKVTFGIQTWQEKSPILQKEVQFSINYLNGDKLRCLSLRRVVVWFWMLKRMPLLGHPWFPGPVQEKTYMFSADKINQNHIPPDQHPIHSTLNSLEFLKTSMLADYRDLTPHQVMWNIHYCKQILYFTIPKSPSFNVFFWMNLRDSIQIPPTMTFETSPFLTGNFKNTRQVPNGPKALRPFFQLDVLAVPSPAMAWNGGDVKVPWRWTRSTWMHPKCFLDKKNNWVPFFFKGTESCYFVGSVRKWFLSEIWCILVLWSLGMRGCFLLTK